ncbi:cell division protein Ftsk/SpoIIIE [Mycobacteroides abscessus subsp. bolletii]|nr:FtsK/SpoIIIE domain-containing protein [Mycobacteroides abscessus]SKS87424.1 cell division protein Ftsk/SpoIIIE [Mycobacteroides abscessus subsp. abscessus]SHU29977.1 cell division protein Ftsk/SpoIIIE [Mycobacteroides abscessus subsp. bolletii]SHW20244.1 cell division protein Ftsk/SpoIIIE [Mycobacteroides abscessus subsp. bolletii]SHW21485.1 cell division protein Ftsk/SpoIIIE [Mycobacteroides abscessus subsp. bolletii]SHW70060.1 cell division protein Ftsk/SpoIIIE [Mycobacteroides abscessus
MSTDYPYPTMPELPDYSYYPSGGVDLIHLVTVAGIWLAVIAGLTLIALTWWKHADAGSFEQYLAGPLRRARWRWWLRGRWSHIAKRCGLSVSEQVTKKDNEGKPTTTTVWTHPTLTRVSTSETCLYATVRTRVGQTVDDLEAAVPAIRDAAGAHSARSTVVAPGTVRMEFVMREHLSVVSHAPTSPTPTTQPRTSAMSAVSATHVRLGLCENGSPWILPIAQRQTMVVGSSRSGKGSLVQGIACGFGPAVQAGLVHLAGIDLKFGIELAPSKKLFTHIATTEEDAVKTLAALEKLMKQRGEGMADNARNHTPTTASPLVVLIIDELATLTHYMSDPTLKKQANASLNLILSKAAGLGIVVAAFLQDPRKEVLPMRGLFTQTIALRLRSRDEVNMVLGDGMADKAPAHRIDPNKPGTGYVIAEDGATMKVRAHYWTDDQIRTTATQYQPPAPRAARSEQP